MAAVDIALSKNTIDSYWFWTKRFFVCSGKRGSETWRGVEWERFERFLISENYSVSARKQARCAVNFIFKHVLKMEVGKLDLPELPRSEKALKIIPTREELGRVFAGLSGFSRIKALLLYGSGPRIEESCRIRVQDVDLATATLRIWDGKGAKNRNTVLPLFLLPALEKLIAWRRALHEWDLANGNGYVELPGRLAMKYKNANRAFGWQWLFPSQVVRNRFRWYSPPDDFSRALRKAVQAAGVVKRLTPHTLRHAFASHLHHAGAEIETIRQLLGHKNLETTLTYLHAGPERAFSPLDVPSAALRADFAVERRQHLSLPVSR